MKSIRLSAFLLFALLCPTGLYAQQVITSPPKDVAIVDFLGETGTPIPVEITGGIEIVGMPGVTVKEMPPVEMPPWVKPGLPWIESPKLKIASVSGMWVELVDAAGAGEPGVWIYLPTGVVYGDSERVANYKRLTGK